MILDSMPPIDADVIVVGAGPSGMAAASELAEAGSSVIVLDLGSAPGGQIFRGLEGNVAELEPDGELLTALGQTYTSGVALIQRFRAASSIDYRPVTTVWEVRPDGTVGWLKNGQAGYLRAQYVLLANGAMERPVPFRGWTLPGVMTAGAVQTLLKAGRLKPTGRVIIAGTGPLVALLAEQLRRLGIRPTLIAWSDRFSDSLKASCHLVPGALPALVKGLGWLARSRLARIPSVSGVSKLEAEGTDHLETVRYWIGDNSYVCSCDLLIVHDGIVPSIDLTLSAGLSLEWDRTNASWRPKTSEDGAAVTAERFQSTSQPCKVRVTGDARRIGGADAAIAHGRLAALAILGELDGIVHREMRSAAGAARKSLVARPFLDAAFPPGLSADLPDDEVVVCRCEELTAGTLRAKIRSGPTNIDLLRGETRCGMGPCQGRSCMITLARMIADDAIEPVPAPPTTFRARPPARPLPLGALANLVGIDPEAAKIESLEDKPHAGVVETDRAGHD